VKNQKWVFFKSAIITYLAISKILNWVDTASDMIQGDVGGAYWWFPIFARLVVREVPLILAVLGFVLIHKSRGRLWIKLIIGYVATIVILFSYIFIAPLFINLTVVTPLLNLFIYYTASYVVINAVLIGKDLLKKKTKSEEVSIIDTKSEEVSSIDTK